MFGICILMLTAAVLMSASLSDIRTRMVEDGHWKILCAAAIISVFVRGGITLSSVTAAAGMVLMAAVMFSEPVKGRITLLSAAVIVMLIPFSGAGYAVSAVMFIVILAMYSAGMMGGGADAKALMSLSMLFPVYPDHCLLFQPEGDLAAAVFNPVFSTVFFAAVFAVTCSALVCLKRSRGKSMTSYPVNIDSACGLFVWPSEDVRGGAVIRYPCRRDPEGVYRRLRGYGREIVMVSPMIPFIVPISAAFLSTAILGSPLFLLV